MSLRASRIERDFAGKSRTVAPVQTEEDGWKKYLSNQERQNIDSAETHGVRGLIMQWGGIGGMWAGKLLLGATVGPPFILLALGLSIYGTVKVAKAVAKRSY